MCKDNHSSIPEDHHIIIDDSLMAWEKSDWKRLLPSRKYYPKKEIPADDKYFVDRNLKPISKSDREPPHLEIPQITLPNGSKVFPYTETEDTNEYQLLNLENFLLSVLKKHKENPDIPFYQTINTSREIFKGRLFSTAYISKDANGGSVDIRQLANSVNSMIKLMGGEAYSAEIELMDPTKLRNEIMFIFINSTIKSNITDIFRMCKCVNYNYVMDCFFNFRLMDHYSYLIKFQ